MSIQLIRRAGPLHEALRHLVGCWPLKRGTQRIPAELGKIFPGFNGSGIAAVAGREVIFPFQPGDVSHPAYWYLYEKEVRRVLRRLLRPGGTFIDVGAHRGFHASFALSLVGTAGYVIACEPNAEHFACLRQLKELNPGRNLAVHHVAVADFTGTTTLLVSEHEGWHTIVPDFASMVITKRTPVPVDCTTLDDLLHIHPELQSDEGPPRIVIKIDAEGAELAILQGAQFMLRSPALEALIVECTGGGIFTESARRCVENLRTGQFHVRVLEHGGPRTWLAEDAKRQVNLIVTRPAFRW